MQREWFRDKVFAINILGPLAQLARASPLQGEGHPFEPDTAQFPVQLSDMKMGQHVIAAIVLSLTVATFGAQPVQPLSADETPFEHEARMRWWRDARFGMFVHWGLYSIPAGEWSGKPTSTGGEWIMHDLQITPAEYEKLAGQFNPTKFDAVRWVQIARDAGMKYIVVTTKHHDGFSLFDSKFSEFDVSKTPFKRDIMRELADAARTAGMQIGWYHSILDWRDPDAQKPETFATYEWRMRSQVNELLTNYGPIGVMWFDGEWIPQWNDQRGRKLYELCRSVQPNVIVNDRVGKRRSAAGGFAGDFATPEQQIPDHGLPGGGDWETRMTMNDTWGFKKSDSNWKSSQTLIRNLIDVASKGGNFLLNVGPNAQGEIPAASVERLNAIGAWLRVNGESIYGTTASPFRTKVDWGTATAKGNRIYLHVFDWPKNRELKVPLLSKPTRAFVLGTRDVQLGTQSTKQGLLIRVPETAANNDATVIVLEISGNPQVVQPPPPPAPPASTTATTATTTTTTTSTATTKTTAPTTAPATSPARRNFPA